MFQSYYNAVWFDLQQLFIKVNIILKGSIN